MTNTKFRKRALLSSVAMLLVALVALGSATFAWFVDSPLADAKGLSAKAETSTGLLIKTETNNTYSHHATIGNNVTGVVLSPATTNNGTDYWSVEALASTGAAPDPGKKWNAVTGANLAHTSNMTGVYHEQMTLTLTTPMTGENTQDVNLTGLDMNVNSTHKYASAVTVVLKYGSTVKYFKKSGNSWNSWTTLNANTNANNTPDMDMSTDTVTAAASITAQKVGTFSASVTEIPVDLYIFLDGQNSAVYTDNADASELLQTTTSGSTTKYGVEAYFALAD